MSTIAIPLSKLRISPINVRHPIEGDVANDVHDLQASILAHGLMNPLVVHKMTKPKGTYGVIAGGRRLRALQGLLADGRISADHVVDCYESTATESSMTEMSIAENLVRVALKPTAEYEAFAKLAAAGADEAAIAERFAVTVLHVRQRMRLGRLHPDILAAFDEHKITLDHAKAYAATEDQALQARVFAEMSKGYAHYPHNIRNATIAASWPAGAYEAQGEGHRAYCLGAGTLALDWDEVWHSRIVSIGAKPLRDAAAGVRHAVPVPAAKSAPSAEPLAFTKPDEDPAIGEWRTAAAVTIGAGVYRRLLDDARLSLDDEQLTITVSDPVVEQQLDASHLFRLEPLTERILRRRLTRLQVQRRAA